MGAYDLRDLCWNLILEPKRRFFKLALVERLVPGVALPAAVGGNMDTIID